MLNNQYTENIYKLFNQFGHKQTKSVGRNVRYNVENSSRAEDISYHLFFFLFQYGREDRMRKTLRASISSCEFTFSKRQAQQGRKESLILKDDQEI